MLQRLVAYFWGGGLVVLSAWPALRKPAVDSYPLSTSPMFSAPRGQPVIDRMVAIDRDKTKTPVPPFLVSNAETLQAAATIRRAVAEGEHSMSVLCHEVAQRVASEPRFSQAAALEIRRERFDPIAYFEHTRLPLESRRLVRCQVRR